MLVSKTVTCALRRFKVASISKGMFSLGHSRTKRTIIDVDLLDRLYGFSQLKWASGKSETHVFCLAKNVLNKRKTNVMLFNPENHTKSERHIKIYAYCELAYTVVDFSAAALFVVGSILFFSEATVIAGTWLFLIGSVFFGLRPSIKLFRELAYLRIGDFGDVAKTLK